MKKTLALLLLLAGLTVGAQGRTLTWAPTPDNNSWDTTTANWLAEDGNATVFQNGDDVVFSDTGLAVLECELAPTSVLVDTSGNISFQAGSHDFVLGRLTGSMQLIKDGSGTLAIRCANSYTGGTVLYEGTIVMYSSGAFGTGGITLNGGTLDLQQNAIDSDKVTLKGAATINNGIIVVAVNKTFTLGDRLSGTVGFALGNHATLNLGQSTIDSDKVILQGDATINNGSLYVGENKTFTLDSRLSGTVSFTLGDNATLDLGQNTISSSVTLQGNAFIGNGSIDLLITVGQYKHLTLLANTTIFGDIILGDDATLDLGGNAIDSYKLALHGSAIIGNGKINGNLAMQLGHSLTLLANTTITGDITLGDDATLDLGGNAIDSNKLALHGSAIIGNGTIIGHRLRVEGDSTLTLFGITRIDGVTITAGQTQVKSLVNATPGLLQELTVSEGLIAGTDRQTSLADGLEIESEANLMIKSMTITANNSISVGKNTITLQDVTIKLSQYDYDLEKGIFYFDLQNLINCDLVMENVLLDASDLTLPEGFDPAKVAVEFDFGDDVTIKQATGLDMRLGNYWSPSLNLQDGKVVFKNLVETPEPATGTLSLLALATFAARRRRK